MIFVTVGSQKFQFNRILIEIDRLIEEGKITKDLVFAQIGYSTYEPRNYKSVNFLNKSEFHDIIKNSDIVISHGGTGSIINSVKKGKKVIGIPRRAEYGEHVDNHQMDIINEFSDSNFIYPVYEVEELEKALDQINNVEFKKYISNTSSIVNIIEEFING
ncbi:PssE/Cps14G family polysaccharide biosynthesis glycosyltransferase [Niallia sp. MER 6]|uniref:PssE/Cps14G family polysaccharide biosynthesis glycosyltransferase n=1 Tax=Niallia sp. MER 6 TaxID=2939567 RepID=UPI00203BB248|nr:PssE/Cps14G family polysaccharide biosynthesis glycosyltransferase [Niallia sp. MER 6]MCM3029815.1 beta(1,3)galactosyltransferase EpsH [Niallia sp. MER 6]